MNNKKISLLIIILLIADQAVKFAVKCNMTLGESITVFPNWFQILFVENYGKLALSLFRIAAVCALGWYINYLGRRKAPTGVIVGMALILAGALGNIIDSAFYGLIFSESTFTQVATLFPAGGGYAGLLHGKVVDMLYFPLFTIENTPSWLGFLSGADGSFTFFAPVFNIADSYITVAVFYLLIFHWRYFK